MLKIKKILFATDFSENSELAQQYACDLACTYKAELHIVNVELTDVNQTTHVFGEMIPQAIIDSEHKAREEKLSKLPDEKWGKPASITRKILNGPPFVEIIQYSKNNNIDMVVLGTHGHTGLKHLLMGSVAENVVRNSSVPVLTVRPKDHDFVMP